MATGVVGSVVMEVMAIRVAVAEVTVVMVTRGQGGVSSYPLMDKLEDIEFIKLLNIETLADQDNHLEISGFKCFKLYRNFQNRRAKRCSSGVTV